MGAITLSSRMAAGYCRVSSCCLCCHGHGTPGSLEIIYIYNNYFAPGNVLATMAYEGVNSAGRQILIF